MNIDWEKEYDHDYVYALEREMDLQASWEQWEREQNRKPAKIIFNENHIRKSSFYRTAKKILQLRSHLPLKTSK
jgi:hypothetical protein